MTPTLPPTLPVARALVAAGISVIPIRKDGSKRPALSEWKPYQVRRAAGKELDRWFANGIGIAVVNGAISGNLETLDIDAPELYPAWAEEVERAAPGLLEQLPEAETPSGGRQLYYRCDEALIPGNLKLAQRPPTAEEAEASPGLLAVVLFETRGEGGYAIIPPTPAACHPDRRPYVMLRGNVADAPVITAAERDALHDSAKLFNTYVNSNRVVSGARTPVGIGNGERPGDAYNNTGDWAGLLERHGWRFLGERGSLGLWQRPGKPEFGISATTNYADSGLLYVFSSNAAPFEHEHAYSLFAAYALLEHHGDYKAAAGALAQQGYGTPRTPRPSSALRNTPSAAPASVLATANMTDAGNGECFAALYGAAFRYCPQLAGKGKERWLSWDGARWIMDEGGAAQRAMLETMRLRYHSAWNIDDKDLAAKAAKWALGSESMQRRKAALESARSIAEMVVHIGQIDVDPFLAAVQNGTLDLRTGTLRASRADDYLMQRLGTRYDPEATCPRWRAFLGEVFNGDAALIAYIQRAVGYSLTGDTREQKWFLCFGKGSNGKGVFLRVLSWLMGDYAGNASFETFDAAKRSESTNDLAALKGKRLVTISETDEDRRLSEARMKQATGEDPITCRFLYNEQFTYIPAFKIWMIVNHLPIMRDSGDGNWRRPQLVPFTQSFLGREDFTLKPALHKELPGILNWALEGLRAWQRDGLGSAPAVVAATQKHRSDSDTVGLWLADYAIDEPGAVLPALEAYKDYGEWSDERGMRYPLSYMSWQRAMSDRGYRADRHRSDGRRIAVFLGVRKRTDADDAAEEDSLVDGVDGVVNGFSENSRNSNFTKRVFRKTASNPVHPVQTEDALPPTSQLERVPMSKRTIVRGYLRSTRDSDMARARELCEEYGLDYEAAKTEANQ